MLYHSENAKKRHNLKADSIRTDLDIAATFAEIAFQMGEWEKTIRNQRNARKGYDVVFLAVSNARLTHVERENIRRKLGSLKSALQKLGEAF